MFTTGPVLVSGILILSVFGIKMPNHGESNYLTSDLTISGGAEMFTQCHGAGFSRALAGVPVDSFSL